MKLSHMLKSLKNLKYSDKKKAGNKFYNLSKVYKFGLNVPEAYCLTANFFSKYKKKCRSVQSLKVDLYERQKIIFDSLDFNDEDLSLLNEIFKCFNDKNKKIAVRSSSSLEDSGSSSHAGIFYSKIGIDNFADFIIVIKKCFASSVNGNDKTGNMAVIIQEALIPLKSGVIFTNHPFLRNNDIHIEIVDGLCENLVSGQKCNDKITLKRKEYENCNVFENVNDFKLKLYLIVKDCERIFRSDKLDIEWLFHQDKIFIVQVRNITTSKNKTDNYFLDADDVESNKILSNYDDNGYIQSWLEKKYRNRRIAENCGINIFKSFWLIVNLNNKKFLNNIVKRIKKEIKTDFILIIYGKRPFKSKIASVKKLLDNLKNIINLSDKTYYISEFNLNKINGFSYMNGDKSVYIEYALNSLKQLKEGKADKSVLIINDKINILKKGIGKNCYRTFFDPINDCISREIDNTLDPSINYENLKELYMLNGQFNKEQPSSVIEWCISYDDELYFWDSTFNVKRIKDLNENVISFGQIIGNVFIIDNINIIEKKFKDFDFSVASYENGEEGKFGKNYNEILNEIIKIKTPRICIAEYPATFLTLFLHLFNGFVFEKGSLLCHLAIILREKNIPAVISEKVRNFFSSGEFISLSND